MKRRELLLAFGTIVGWANLSQIVRAWPQISGETKLEGIVITHAFGEAMEFSVTFERYHDRFLGQDVYEIVGTNADGGTLMGTIWAAVLDDAMKTLNIKAPLLEYC